MDATIQQQRIQHIVDSYALAGRETAAFRDGLAAILDQYSFWMVEWALVDVLVQNWLRYPLPRGRAFLHQVEGCLQTWVHDGAISSALTPEQFQLIAGLPAPTFINDILQNRTSQSTQAAVRKQLPR